MPGHCESQNCVKFVLRKKFPFHIFTSKLKPAQDNIQKKDSLHFFFNDIRFLPNAMLRKKYVSWSILNACCNFIMF